MSVFYRGTEDEILETLRELHDREGHGATVTGRLAEAMGQIAGGERFLIAAGWRFEVVEPVQSIEQDVYGCASGPACTDVHPALRPRLDAMVAERRAAHREPRDERSFHWFRRFRPQDFRPADARSFVDDTLGWDLVATAAETMADAVLQAPDLRGEIDLHLTMLPRLVRLRFDLEAGQPTDRSEGGGHDSAPKIGQARTSWTVTENQASSQFAEFDREPEGSASLASSLRYVRGDQIGFGAYIYVPHRYAWMQFEDRHVRNQAVEFAPAEEFTTGVSYPAHEDVAVFWNETDR